MNDDILNAKVLLACCIFLLGFAVVLRAVRALAGRDKSTRTAHQWGLSSDDGGPMHFMASSIGSTSALAATGFAQYGPLVNVDGTPMLDGAIDVMGKPYGDTGAYFGHSFSSVNFSDESFSSGMDLSHGADSSW